MANVSDVKKGIVIRWNDSLWSIVDFLHVSPGKGQTFTKIKLKNLANGKVVENTFKSGVALDIVDVAKKNMQYLFDDGTRYTFMDMVSYEQVEVEADVVGDVAKYLRDELEVLVAMQDTTAIYVELPKKIQYVVTEADHAVKGDTASGNVQKYAIMDNGLEVRVPIFINVGDKILVNTDSGDYAERVK